MVAKEAPWWRSLTKYQWLVLIVCWLGWVFDVFDTSLFFLAKQSIITEFFGPSAYMKGGHGSNYDGIILGCFYAGWALGGLFFGILADRWGRVKTLVVTILLYCFFTALTIFCRSWWDVAIIRFFTALGIGGEWAAGTALVAEVLPNRARSGAAGLLQSAAAIGPVLAALANLALINQGWRYLFLVGAVPALLTIIIRLQVKEPERWKQAVKTQNTSPFSTLKELLANRQNRRLAFVALTITVVGILGASNISYWLPNLVTEASPGLSAVAIKTRQSYAQMIMHIGTIIGVFFFPMLCEKIGRKPAFLTFLLISPFAVAGVTFAHLPYEMLILVAPIMSFFVLGLTAGFPLYIPELFPTRYRATGMGFSYNTGRCFLIPWPILTGFLITSVGGVGVGVGLTAMVFFVGAFAMMFAPETKGKPLPE
jgi:MFS family permease